MDVCSYASDLNDAEWALLAPLVPAVIPPGGDRPIRCGASSMRSSICCALAPNGACCRMSTPRVVPSSSTMRSGARMAPGST